MSDGEEPTGNPPLPEKKEPLDIDEDRFELLERRLAENVDNKVRQSLFKFYGAIGVVVVAVAGYAGFDFVQQTKKDAQDQAAAAAKEIVDTQVKPVADEAERTLNDLKIKMGVFDELQSRAVAAVDDLQKKLIEFEPQAKSLSDTIAKVEALDLRRRDLESRLDSVASLVGSLEEITRNMTDLARKVDSLAESVGNLSHQAGETKVLAETAALRSQLSTVITNTEQAQTTIQDVQQTAAQTTVYFQYYAMQPDQVQAIQEALRKASFKVPGAEKQPMPQSGLFEVRYYWASDRPEADRLAQAASNAMKEANIATASVDVQDYTKYTRAKPRAGTIELWLGLPSQAAAE